MPTTHFTMSVDMQGGDAPSADAIRAALEAAFPGMSARVRDGFPQVVVVVPDDPDESLIFGTDGRVGAMIVDARTLDPDGLALARERIAAGDSVEFGSGPTTFAKDCAQAVAKLDEIISGYEPGAGFL